MPGIDTGDTAWVLLCAALVMFMTPGLAFFYGGLVRAKHVLGTIMQSFIALAVVTVLWVLGGYSLAFGPDKAGLIGGLDFVGLHNVGAAPSAYAPTIPATAYMVFQMMFAIITPALIAGAFAERMKFGLSRCSSRCTLVVYARGVNGAAASSAPTVWVRSTSRAGRSCRERRRSCAGHGHLHRQASRLRVR